MSKEHFKEEKVIAQRDIENKQLKEENEKLRKENEKLRREDKKREMTNDKRKMTNENEQFLKNSIVKDANIKEFIEESKEIKSPNWLDKNKFKGILAIIDSNKLNYKNKICEFKHIDIKNLVNNRNHTISEIDAKKDLNTLNEIKNTEIIKCKKHTPGHKKLLNIFNDLLGIIVTEKTLESESQKDKSKNENENENIKNKINSTNIKKQQIKKKVRIKTFC